MPRPAVLLVLALVCAACGGGDLTLPGGALPARLTIVAGDSQTGVPGAPLPDPLVVAVEDIEHRPIAGAVVGFRFAEDLPDAAVSPGSVATDSAGRASVRVQLGLLAGPQPVEAAVAVPGADLLVRFHVTAIQAGGGGDSGTGGGGSSTGGSGSGSGGGGSAGGGGSDSGGSGGGGTGSGGPGHGGGHGAGGGNGGGNGQGGGGSDGH